MSDGDRWNDLRVDLEAWAAAHDAHPMQAPRSALTEAGHHWVKRAGRWGAVKRRALGENTEASEEYAKPTHPFPIMPEGQRLKGVSTLVDGQWVKCEAIRLSPIELMEQALENAAEWIDAVPDPVPCPPVTEADLLAVYAIGDMHHGMRAWLGDAGADWDMDKSEAIHREAMAALVEEGPPARRALIINVGDALHVDNNTNATNRSKHPLDLAARWAEAFHSLLRLKIHMIELALQRHASVTVEIVNGNHDEHSAITLAAALHQRFHNEPRVAVSLSSQAHRYHRFGQCLIGVAHGHHAKIKDLGEIMSVDAREDWGQTLHRLWITGHTHHTERIELRGCVVEILRTLAPNDHHSQGSGYRSGREMTRINLHREWGERGRQIVPAAYLMQRIAEAS